MPKRTDLRSILIIGSGPIRIGQGCEFDYSASQACRVLRREGLRVVLVNSNPATIMTDPEWADATYIEPLDLETVTEVIAAERPDALLPTLGGQTALNLAVELHEAGVLAEHGVELLGASVDAIRAAEDRLAFRDAMVAAGLQVPLSAIVTSGCLTPGHVRPHGNAFPAATKTAGFPLPVSALDTAGCLTPGHVRPPAIVRPAFTLGGSGGGIARTPEELERRIAAGLAASPLGQVLVEESLEGWQEFELEVMCDSAGNCVVVCSIENLDPMGVHTGDSWTVAPQQTLPDAEYQRLREAAFACARAIGVATGGANVQFAYEPATCELRVIEMNPRVSRSSALASKATGFPIAKIAALLAIGYTLDELPNDITQQTTAAFEPALDYVAVKAPRFDFEKFPDSDDRLGSEMRAVGESLGLGRTFPEAFLKALDGREWTPPALDLERRGLPVPERWDLLLEAARRGLDLPGIHPYFAQELRDIAAAEQLPLLEAKRFGIPDSTFGDPLEVRKHRPLPGRLAVDSCAAEFEARTPYFYLSYEPSDASPTPSGRAVVVLGSGPNRIGQGLEFDYCCVHAARTFRALGYEAVLVNPNPETVSTDYDTSDRLYLEPLTLERALDVCALEQPLGVVVSFGGQTPLRLATGLADAGVPLLGNPLAAIDAAEDRARFARLLDELGLRAPQWRAAADANEARAAAEELGYPVLVRPHHVIGGQGIHVARNASELDVRGPCLIDRYLENAVELDVDVLCDGTDGWVAAILEHVERAGSHSGDSAVVVPAPSVTRARAQEIREAARAVSTGLDASGLLNLQLALADDDLYVLEANPRASRTVPFVAKATGVPLVEHACRLLLGTPLAELDLPVEASPTRAWAKEAVFPSDRFARAATRGPEMRSTGEVMAGGPTPAAAYARALRAAGASTRGGHIGAPLQRS